MRTCNLQSSRRAIGRWRKIDARDGHLRELLIREFRAPGETFTVWPAELEFEARGNPRQELRAERHAKQNEKGPA